MSEITNPDDHLIDIPRDTRVLPSGQSIYFEIKETAYPLAFTWIIMGLAMCGFSFYRLALQFSTPTDGPEFSTTAWIYLLVGGVTSLIMGAIKLKPKVALIIDDRGIYHVNENSGFGLIRWSEIKSVRAVNSPQLLLFFSVKPDKYLYTGTPAELRERQEMLEKYGTPCFLRLQNFQIAPDELLKVVVGEKSRFAKVGEIVEERN